jgi:hypothetical protein
LLFKGTNYYLGIHQTINQACDVFETRSIKLGLREPRPKQCFPALPEGGVNTCALELMKWQDKKQAVIASKVDKYSAVRGKDWKPALLK